MPVPALGLADLPEAWEGRSTVELRPIATPVTVAGADRRTLARLRALMRPARMIPVQGGGVDRALPVAARLEPGAPMGIVLLRGDMTLAATGTITDVVGDRLWGFGHSMFGEGRVDLPLTTGVAHAVIPSVQQSFRMASPVKEVGRLTWDEETAVFGRLGDDQRAPVFPVRVTLRGPGAGEERAYSYEAVRHRFWSGRLAMIAAFRSLFVQSRLPEEHTVRYTVRVKPAGRPAVERANIASWPEGDLFAVELGDVVSTLMSNPFEELDVEAAEVVAEIEPRNRLAEIVSARALVNRIRPGGTVPVQLEVLPWQGDTLWTRVEVPVPADYPEGPCSVVLCGGDASLRRDRLENPARFRPRDIDALVELLRAERRRDRLYVRLPETGAGLTIGDRELPNLPDSMRAVLSGAARRRVLGLRGSRVTVREVPYVLVGETSIAFTVDRDAPES